MKNSGKLFRTAIICAVFTMATATFTSCANGTSTTGSDTTTTAPAAADTMSSPSSATAPMDTTRKDSM